MVGILRQSCRHEAQMVHIVQGSFTPGTRQNQAHSIASRLTLTVTLSIALATTVTVTVTVTPGAG